MKAERKTEKKTERKTKKRLLISYDGKPLTKEQAKEVLKQIKRAHAHVLGRKKPSECSGYCKHNFYAGHGVCLLYMFVERREGCVGCRAEEPLKQLRYIFSHHKLLLGHSAEWVTVKKVRKVA